MANDIIPPVLHDPRLKNKLEIDFEEKESIEKTVNTAESSLHPISFQDAKGDAISHDAGIQNFNHSLQSKERYLEKAAYFKTDTVTDSLNAATVYSAIRDNNELQRTKAELDKAIGNNFPLKTAATAVLDHISDLIPYDENYTSRINAVVKVVTEHVTNGQLAKANAAIGNDPSNADNIADPGGSKILQASRPIVLEIER